MPQRFVISLASALVSVISHVSAFAATSTHTEIGMVLNTNFDSKSCSPAMTTWGGASSACALSDSAHGSGSNLSASAMATPGVLRAKVDAYIDSAYPGNQLAGLNTAANGAIRASQQDTLTLTAPGLNGTTGTLVGGYFLHGSATAAISGMQGVNTSGNDSFANFSFGGELKLGSAKASFGGQGAADITLSHPTPSVLPGYVQLTTSFTFGSPLPLSSSVAMDWSSDARRVVLYSGTPPFLVPVNTFDSTANIEGKFGDTIYWAGIVSVTDSVGNAVAFTLTSESGFDYGHAAAVPEPSRVVLMFTGIAVLLGWRRRVPRPVNSAGNAPESWRARGLVEALKISTVAALLCAAQTPAQAYNYGGTVQAGAGWRDGTFGTPTGAYTSPGGGQAAVDQSGTHFTPWTVGSGSSTELGSANASSRAGPGGLHLLASSSGSVTNAQPGVAVGGRASADASGYVDDSFVIQSATMPAGALVTMVFDIGVHGSASGTGNWDGSSGGGWNGYAQWAAALHLVGTGSACGCTAVDWSARRSVAGSQGAPLRVTGNGVFGDQLFTAQVIIGSPVSMHLTGEVHSAASGIADFLLGGGASATFEANLSHTIGWGGIVQLRDASGRQITDFTAISTSSGFDYRQSALVPEPASWALMLAGALALGGWARNRREGEGKDLEGHHACAA
ncbi:MAG: PEP-CTERM sorting domain-containing protein [Burkholderiales bacterium]|nr:PEP-CTERM sorting domain-containing protein [Burkholderiales bacterium]